jgi:hypothetical protein
VRLISGNPFVDEGATMVIAASLSNNVGIVDLFGLDVCQAEIAALLVRNEEIKACHFCQV